MDFSALATARYSLRKFSSAPVEPEKLALILEAGRNAPTAHNYQPQRIFVLQTPEALEKADACMGSHFHPPVILAVAYDPQVSWKRETDGKDHGEIDASLAVSQMMLQAADLGLGGHVPAGKAAGGLPGDGGALSHCPAPSGLSGGGGPSRPAPHRPPRPGGTGAVSVKPF